MDFKGLRKLTKLKTKNYKNTVFLILVFLSICGCDRPKSSEEFISDVPLEKIKKVELVAKPIQLPETPPQVIIDKSSRVTILGYHQITDRGSPSEMRIGVEKFRSQMQALRDAGVKVISHNDYLLWKADKKPIPETCVIITIDDGYDDIFDNALPILKEFKYPFTFYLYTKFFGGSGRTLNESEVKELILSGGELASHSTSHNFLIRARKNFSDQNKYEEWLLKEIKGSKDSLEKIFGVTVNSFAYPYGEYSDLLATKVKEAGYHSAVTVNGAKANYASPMYELPRYIIHGNNDINWKAGTSFGGNVGLSNQPNSSNVSIADGKPKIKFWPRAKSKIIDRLPEIRADLSEFSNIDPQKITKKVSGFGVVPSDFDEDKGIVRWRVPRKLRVKSTSVFLSFVDPLDETNKNISWSFNLNLSAYYLPEYVENVKKERELMKNIFSQ